MLARSRLEGFVRSPAGYRSSRDQRRPRERERSQKGQSPYYVIVGKCYQEGGQGGLEEGRDSHASTQASASRPSGRPWRETRLLSYITTAHASTR